jgi:hypothetical protein
MSATLCFYWDWFVQMIEHGRTAQLSNSNMLPLFPWFLLGLSADKPWEFEPRFSVFCFWILKQQGKRPTVRKVTKRLFIVHCHKKTNQRKFSWKMSELRTIVMVSIPTIMSTTSTTHHQLVGVRKRVNSRVKTSSGVAEVGSLFPWI